MPSIEFTGNYEDLSTDRGYQFKFYCEKCGNGYMSSFKASKLGMASSAMQAAGDQVLPRVRHPHGQQAPVRAVRRRGGGLPQELPCTLGFPDPPAPCGSTARDDRFTGSERGRGPALAAEAQAALELRAAKP